MVGIVIVGHCNFAAELYAVLKTIVGDIEHVEPVTFEQGEAPEKSIKKVAAAVQKVDAGQGVLILTDMFGGTPSNLSYSFLEEGKVEVISGVNLPILIKAVESRNKMALGELAKELEVYGKKSISLASGILKGNKRG